MLRPLIVVILIALLPQVLPAQEVSWLSLAPDIELTEFTVGPPAILSSKLIIVRSSLKMYRPGVVQASLYGSRRLPVKELVSASNALIGINANFFDERGDPLGLVVSGGNIHRKIHYGGQTLTGIFALGQNGIEVSSRERFRLNGVLEAVQAGPRLMINGQTASGLRDVESTSRRAGLCIDRDKRLLIFVSSGFGGLSLRRLIDSLHYSEIGCVDTLNLDGGGSAQLYVDPSLLKSNPDLGELYVQGRDPIPVMLGLFLREGSLAARGHFTTTDLKDRILESEHASDGE